MYYAPFARESEWLHFTSVDSHACKTGGREAEIPEITFWILPIRTRGISTFSARGRYLSFSALSEPGLVNRRSLGGSSMRLYQRKYAHGRRQSRR